MSASQWEALNPPLFGNRFPKEKTAKKSPSVKSGEPPKEVCFELFQIIFKDPFESSPIKMYFSAFTTKKSTFCSLIFLQEIIKCQISNYFQNPRIRISIFPRS